MIVAIDGPAGSGKGTVTSLIAEKLNLTCIDTGATYRALALYTIKNNISLEDRQKIIDASKHVDIKMIGDRVYLDNIDVTKEIRSTEVTSIVSQVSSIKEVRENMVYIQRKMAEGLDVIMEGRDITTVVFPDADYKFYLDASLEERAKRRFLQNQSLKVSSSMEEIIDNIKFRDYNDMNKEVGSLMRTNDQIYIDSTNLSIDEVVNLIVAKIRGE